MSVTTVNGITMSVSGETSVHIGNSIIQVKRKAA